MLKNRQVSLKQKIGIIIGIGIFLTAFILIFYGAYQARKEAIMAASHQAVAIASEFSADIQIILEEAMDASRAMGNALSAVGENELHGQISRTEAVAMAEKVLFSNPDFLGFTLGFEPQAFDSKDEEFINAPAHDATGRFISYLTKGEDGRAVVDALIDYETADKGPWYWMPKQRMTDFLTEPVVYPVQGVDVTMVSCMTPVIYRESFLGVTGIDYPIDFMQEQATAGDYYEGQFQMSIVSNEGVYAANKNNPERVNTSIREYVSDDFESQMKVIKAGESVILSDKEYLNVYVPLQIARTGTPWQVRFSVPYSLITKHANELMWSQIGIGLVLVLLGIGLVVWYVSRLIKPIDGMVRVANAMAEGDLKTTVDIKITNDEIGELILAFGTMKTKIIEIVNQIKDGADQIAGASVQMSATSMSLSQGASEQASATEQVSSTMEEITSNINQNRDNAGQTEKITDVVAKGIEEGAESALVSVKAMHDIIEKISFIKDIAFQTNILALNAAVEAARSGEHGKGFAVVAAEVRKLAEHTSSASIVIDDLTKKSQVTVERNGEIMESIVPQMSQTAKLVMEISASSNEQATGAEQVNNAIQELGHVTQQTAAASEELASSAEELSAQAESLKKVISFFKL